MAGTSKGARPVVFGAAIFLAAFLLFQVEPLIARLILPWFGGSAGVWTTCMLFFQTVLLAGYAYAHWLQGRSAATQRTMHLLLLGLSLLWLPILPSAAWKPHGPEDPLPRILGVLAATIGLPFLLLSSTNPLLQRWFSRDGGKAPYRLFALSNAGSMSGLLVYPILVEPYLTGRQQAWTWSVGYVAFVVLCAAASWRAVRADEAAASGELAKPGERLLWFVLSACPSALLLAATNHMTANIAAIPFLWVVPLSLYLLSFILAFESARWYRRWLFGSLAAVSFPLTAWITSGSEQIADLRLLDMRSMIAILCAAIFAVFMVCHGELARRRPAPARLTSFYLMVAAGGAAGGMFIGVVAPYCFNGLYDLPIVLSGTAFLFIYLLWMACPADRVDAEPRSRGGKTKSKREPAKGAETTRFVWTLAGATVVYIAARVIGSAFGATRFLQASYDTTVLLILTGSVALYWFWQSRRRRESRLILLTAAAGMALGYAGILARETWRWYGYARLLARNFYGSLVVYDDERPRPMGPVRVLRNGAIDHGEQFLWPENRRHATTYYARTSGVGRALEALMARGPVAVGVVGLGAGTLVVYARPVDRYYLYELNPKVVAIAESQFTFLRDCPAPHEVIQGDARLSLEREAPRGFDLLALDAFSGDSIPVHLLTREAFQLYWKHLKTDGVLAVHVSNKYLSLGPVVAMQARESGKEAALVSYAGKEADEESSSDWVLVTSREGFLDLPEILGARSPIAEIPGLRMWTDDYSNLYRILR